MVWGAIISAGASLLGGAMANRSRSEEASINRDFQEEMSRTQYQRAMEDMRQAGLNPMLAFSQGGNAVPAGAMPQIENIGSSAAQAYAAGLQAEASSQQSETAATIGTVTIEKIKQETANLTDTNDQIRSIVRNMNAEYYKIIEETNNAVEAGNAIRATIDKLKAETANLPWQQLQIRAQEMLTMTQAELAKLDLGAAQGMDNIGREAGQLRPVIDILRAIVGGRR